VPLSFIEHNWMLILIVLVSGGMLLWPLIQRPFSRVHEIGAAQATQLINRKNALMLDVRETSEYDGGRVPNAVHVPVSQIAGRAAELKKFMRRPVVAYCDRGNRSRAAATALSKLGFSEVYTLRGGLRAWKEVGLPLEKDQ
jgi:rhodanese-related sulfurtransferase